ncbi:MAG: hypothetical protein JWP31_1675 [Aeromicrobium sp.]|nr:hypothetical protein [Aeromicrobium sp.]
MTAPDQAASEPGPAGSSEPVGSIAEEAFKLFRALAPESATEPGGAAHVCTTSWCPVCQAVGYVRAHPEAVAAVTHSAAALARSLRDLVDAALPPQEEA